MTQVPCWCCGRPTDAKVLTVSIPVALAERLEEYQTEKAVSLSAAVQEALSLLFFEPKREASDG